MGCLALLLHREWRMMNLVVCAQQTLGRWTCALGESLWRMCMRVDPLDGSSRCTRRSDTRLEADNLCRGGRSMKLGSKLLLASVFAAM